MRRVFRQGAACLLTGVALNVLVAWGCSLGVRPEDFRDGRAAAAHWQTRTPRFPEEPVVYTSDECDIPGRSMIVAQAGGWHEPVMQGWDRYGVAEMMVIDRVGWPCRSLEGELSICKSCDPVRVTRYLIELGSLRRWTTTPHLPLKPLWPGFAVNSLVWAAAPLLLATGLRAIRRTFRAARRGCRSCAYPIGLSPVCTECGGMLPAVRFEQNL